MTFVRHRGRIRKVMIPDPRVAGLTDEGIAAAHLFSEHTPEEIDRRLMSTQEQDEHDLRTAIAGYQARYGLPPDDLGFLRDPGDDPGGDPVPRTPGPPSNPTGEGATPNPAITDDSHDQPGERPGANPGGDEASGNVAPTSHAQPGSGGQRLSNVNSLSISSVPSPHGTNSGRGGRDGRSGERSGVATGAPGTTPVADGVRCPFRVDTPGHPFMLKYEPGLPRTSDLTSAPRGSHG